MRKPFGEMTNTPPSKRKHQERTPLKQQSTPNNGANVASSSQNTLTPMANLKLLMNVAASENADFNTRPSRRELFKEDNDENIAGGSAHPQNDSGLVIDDHDYNSSSDRSFLTPGSVTSGILTPVSGMSGKTPKDTQAYVLKILVKYPPPAG